MFTLIGFISFLLYTLWASGVFVLNIMMREELSDNSKKKAWLLPLLFGLVAATCWLLLVTNSPF